jgi:hypothetical protein
LSSVRGACFDPPAPSPKQAGRQRQPYKTGLASPDIATCAASGFRRGAPVAFIIMTYLLIVLQLIVGLGILNVWLLRPGQPTPFRGGQAKTLREEFAAYGLPYWFMILVGVLKVGLALTLLAALWLHPMAQPAAIGLGLLMVGAFVMHLKVKDPFIKALPSIAVLAMCATIVVLV